MKTRMKTAFAAAACISAALLIQTGAAADNQYDCDLLSLAAGGAETAYGNDSNIIAIDDYTTADLTYEGTYVDSSGKVYLKSDTVCNGDGRYAAGSHIAFTAPMKGTISVKGADIGWFEDNKYMGYGGSLTISASAGTTYYFGYRKGTTYVSSISFTPAEGYDYIDFGELADTYGGFESAEPLGDNTLAYLTYEGTYCDSEGVLHLTTQNAGKGNLSNRSYVEFTAPTSGTLKFYGNYVNYYLNGVYKGYANNYSAALNEGDKLQIAARDSGKSTLSRITFSPYYGSYVFSDNKVELTGSDAYNTVIIYKDGDMSDEDIVYIGQAHGRFAAATDFALKKNAADGKYIIWLGGSSEKRSEFYIGMRLNEEVTVKHSKVFTDEAMPGTVAFGWENVPAGTYKSVLIKLDDTFYGFDYEGPAISGGGINLGVQLTGLDPFTSAEAYLSPLSIDEAANAVKGGN